MKTDRFFLDLGEILEPYMDVAYNWNDRERTALLKFAGNDGPDGVKGALVILLEEGQPIKFFTADYYKYRAKYRERYPVEKTHNASDDFFKLRAEFRRNPKILEESEAYLQSAEWLSFKNQIGCKAEYPKKRKLYGTPTAQELYSSPDEIVEDMIPETEEAVQRELMPVF